MIWDSQDITKKLRKVPELIPLIDGNEHTELHRVVSQVPVPCNWLSAKIMKEFYPVRHDTIDTIRNLVSSIEMACEGRDEIIRYLGLSMIASLNLQIPYIDPQIYDTPVSSDNLLEERIRVVS